MVSNYLIFLLSYFLIVFSVVGHGLLAIKLTKTNVSIDEIGFVGLVGIFFLILYSYITHFFISHGYIHNIILLTVGLVSIYYFRNKLLTKKNLIFLFSIFFIIFLAFVIFKTPPVASLYFHIGLFLTLSFGLSFVFSFSDELAICVSSF